MGRAIVYCADCGRSLRDDDFQKGVAGMLENRPFCSACRALPKPSPPSSRPPQMSATRTPKPFAAAPSPRPSKVPLAAGLIVAAAVLVLVVGVSLGGGSPPPPPAPAPSAPSPTRPEAVVPAVKPPDVAAERAAEEKAWRERFERFLKEIRAALDDARFDDRREEIRAMIDKAAELAGPRRGEVDALSEAFARRSLEAALRRGLVGHWKLDEITGTEAADASGSGFHGKVEGGSWTAGKAGSGFETMGGGECVDLPDAPSLRGLQGGAYTAALWYKPSEAATRQHGLVIKPGHHAGLIYHPKAAFRMEHWLDGDKLVAAGADKGYVPGRFYHVAGVVDPQAGQTLLYVDGERVASKSWPPGSAARDYGNARWRLGSAFAKERNAWWPSKGILDDVRLYARALSPEEIRSLFSALRPKD